MPRPPKPIKHSSEERLPPSPADLRNMEAGGPPEEPPRVIQTVKVAKLLVNLAKKVAVLRGVKQEEYIAPVLARCADLVQTEIEHDGPMTVRLRAEAPSNLSAKEPLSTFNADPLMAMRIASLAGQCLTSVAKLLHPHLKALIEKDFSEAVDVYAQGLKVPVLGKVVPGGSAITVAELATAEDFDFKGTFGAEGTFMLRVPDKSMTPSHIVPGDFLVIRRSRQRPSLGSVVIVMQGGKPAMKRVSKAEGKASGAMLQLTPCNYGGPVTTLEDEADKVAGVLVGVVRKKFPDPGK